MLEIFYVIRGRGKGSYKTPIYTMRESYKHIAAILNLGDVLIVNLVHQLFWRDGAVGARQNEV